MSKVLPTQRLAPKLTQPRILLLYGPPKVGKSTFLSKLDNCLVLDGESGHAHLNSMAMDFGSTKDIDETIDAILKKGIELKGQFPYKYIAVDTVDVLERYAESSATVKYKTTGKGKNFDGSTVLELDYGLGYHFLREETMTRILKLAQVCQHLILISHIRTKELDKGGVTVSVNDISLTGKLAQLICNKADAIGYMYRDKKDASKLMVSFAAPDDAITMGCRFPYLAGQKFEADWRNIFPLDFGLPIPGSEQITSVQ